MQKTQTKFWAITVFYLIAVVARALSFQIGYTSNVVDFTYMAIGWTKGVGPCVGAIAAVLLFKRHFHCTITGTSIIKSIISVAVPFIICFFLYRELSYVLLGFIFYSFLEEVGWRGYLQGELKDKSELVKSLIIGTMWFLWHIHIGFNISSLIFWAILVLGAWGIGRIANDTKSLMACACFHTLYNFSKHGFFEFTPLVIGIYIITILSWFIIWYFPWQRISKQTE